MKFLPQILFFFGAVGVFNSIIVSLYFLFSKKYQHLSTQLFGGFLLVLSLRVLKSLFYSFSTVEPISFLQSGPAFFLLIGPMFFTYILSKIRSNAVFIKHWRTHIMFWVVIVLGLMFFYPFYAQVVFNKDILLPLINLQWLVYVIITIWLLRFVFLQKTFNPINDQWLLFLSGGVLILWWSLHFINFDYFISGSIIFSLLFYVGFIYFLVNRKAVAIIFGVAGKQKFKNPEVNDLLTRLTTLLQDQKLYTRPDLKMPEVAEAIGTSPHELSWLINTHLQMGFRDFLNHHRVEEAKKLLLQESAYTIEAIGNQAGFKSKSAFYKAFKKHTGLTPTQYKAQTSS